MKDQFRVGKVGLPGVAVGETGRVVWMHVGQQNRVDVARLDARGRQILQQLAAGIGHVSTATGIDQRQAALAIDQESVHVGLTAFDRAESLHNHLLSLGFRNVMEHIQRAH